MSNKITHCENCPFNDTLNSCNHPLSNGKHPSSIYGDYGVRVSMPNSFILYSGSTSAIPKWCPLRSFKSIDIGVKMDVELDGNLFEENFQCMS